MTMPGPKHVIHTSIDGGRSVQSIAKLVSCGKFVLVLFKAHLLDRAAGGCVDITAGVARLDGFQRFLHCIVVRLVHLLLQISRLTGALGTTNVAV